MSPASLKKTVTSTTQNLKCVKYYDYVRERNEENNNIFNVCT